MKLDFIDDDIVLIIPSNLKVKMIKYLNNLDRMYNLKLFTMDEFKKNIIFDYDEKTIYSLVNEFNLSYENSVNYINNLYYIDPNNNNIKMNYLKEIYSFLDKNNLLIKNSYFKNILKGKNIYFYGFDELNKYELKLIDDIKIYTNTYIVDKHTNNYIHNVLIFNNINEEINFIANDIINKNLDLDKTFIYGINDDYKSTVKRIFANYNLNINFKSNTSLYDIPVATNFLNHLDNIDKSLNDIKDETIKNKIIEILNKYYFINDKTLIKNILINEFKKKKINDIKFQNAVNEIELFDNIINDDEYIYLIGFNNEYIPTYYKDTDFISDKYKPSYLETTDVKNSILFKKWTNIIKNIKNITITASNYNLNKKLNLSTLAKDMNKINAQFNYTTYSHKSNKYNLGVMLDNYNKYQVIPDGLKLLYNNYKDIDYLTYDNSYSKVNYQKNIELSYTAMNSYYECPFKYYCNKILSLNIYEDTFAAHLGSLCHFILSKIYNKDFNFDKVRSEYQDKYILKNEDKLFEEKVLNDLHVVINNIKSMHNQSNYNTVDCEKRITTFVDGVKFNGIVDKILHHQDNIAIIDYKTGSDDINLKLCDYGLNLQLPTYIYLVKNAYKDTNIVGIYLQHILRSNNKYDKNKTELELYEEALKLLGYTINDENAINEFDSTYQKSKFIKGMQMTSNGFSSNAKVLSEEEFENLERLAKNKIINCIKEIKNSNFKIEPKIFKNDNISCKYCPYNIVCYKTDKDYKYIYVNESSGGDTNETN